MPANKYLLSAAAGAFAAALSTTAYAQDDTTLVDVVVITSARANTPVMDVENPDHRPVEGPDASALMSRVPGGARVGNGTLSGQVQYRGLFGHRLNLRIDGQSFASGGPNLMDPPFHYAPTPLIEALEIDRGVSPVSEGPGLAGGVNAVFRRIGFGAGPEIDFGYDLTAQGRSVDDSYAAGGIAGFANETVRFNLMGAYEEGKDTEFPGGVIDSSSYERGVYGFSAGVRGGVHELSLDARRQNTGPSGNPPFPMDIRFFDADIARLAYAANLNGAELTASLGYADVAHAMNNFDLRPAPAAMMQRETFADARTRSAEVGYGQNLAGGWLSVGVDTEDVDRDVTITNPNNAAFFINSFADLQMTRTGAFAQWSGPVGRLESQIGVRFDHHTADAGVSSVGAAVPAMPANLAAAFNAADRSHDDDTVDVVARFWTPSENGLSWRFTLARKTRVPGHVERFSWLPTEASGGLADGNIYVGDLNLDPEVAWIAEAGFDLSGERAYLRPTIYVRRIDDYIQGVPFDATPGVIDTPQEMVANMNGDPTPLRFANVDAKLYGFDLSGGLVLGGGWRLDAVASWVRGERRDISDNLYRVTPPNLTAGLTYEARRWSLTAEGRVVAEQSKISASNSETPTDGYAIVNVYGDWQVRDGVRFSAGVENLFDTKYEEHLGGYNRIAGSDVPVGARLPGPGLGAFVRLSVAR